MLRLFPLRRIALTVSTHFNKMHKNPFLEKFQEKSNRELEQIAENSESYVFDARKAASIILKNRNYNSPLIAAVEREVEIQKSQQINEEIQTLQINRNIVKKLKCIPEKTRKKYILKNGNELVIWRISESFFEVKIVASRSFLAPVMMCKILDDSKYKTFPFIYLKSFLVIGVGGAIVALILSQLKMIGADTIPIPILTSLSIQMLMMPLIYWTILNSFKELLKK